MLIITYDKLFYLFIYRSDVLFYKHEVNYRNYIKFLDGYKFSGFAFFLYTHRLAEPETLRESLESEEIFLIR